MNQPNCSLARTVGVLLHPTSLPGDSFCGTLGKASERWLNYLSNSGIGVWQFLPLAPPDVTGSPYNSPSSFALNPWLIDVEELVLGCYLPHTSFKELRREKQHHENSLVDFNLLQKHSRKLGYLLRKAWPDVDNKNHRSFLNWRSKQYWLEDHSLFMSIREFYEDLPWWEWPEKVATYDKNHLESWKERHNEKLLEHQLLQWHVDRQWQSIKKLAKKLGVSLFGDIPFYVSHDSSDVWSNRDLFTISSNGELRIQAGVPPDYFSSTGQLWGSPTYEWESHKLDKYKWWRRRFSRQMHLVDFLRLDHFRGLSSFWAVPSNEVTAENGYWIESPGEEILEFFRHDCDGRLPLVAEDLGVITPQVEKLRDKFALSGMKILQFAFDGNLDNPYLPENINGYRWIVYNGTHDNPTTVGWWNELDAKSREVISRYLGKTVDSPSWQLLELGLCSEACLVVTQIQDLLCLGNDARFNEPGTTEKNWSWRIPSFDSRLEMALKEYGERAAYWGRYSKFTSELLDNLFSR